MDDPFAQAPLAAGDLRPEFRALHQLFQRIKDLPPRNRVPEREAGGADGVDCEQRAKTARIYRARTAQRPPAARFKRTDPTPSPQLQAMADTTICSYCGKVIDPNDNVLRRLQHVIERSAAGRQYRGQAVLAELARCVTGMEFMALPALAVLGDALRSHDRLVERGRERAVRAAGSGGRASGMWRPSALRAPLSALRTSGRTVPCPWSPLRRPAEQPSRH